MSTDRNEHGGRRATRTSFLDYPPGKAASTSYCVVTFDAAGNVNAHSNSVSA